MRNVCILQYILTAEKQLSLKHFISPNFLLLYDEKKSAKKKKVYCFADFFLGFLRITYCTNDQTKGSKTVDQLNDPKKF